MNKASDVTSQIDSVAQEALSVEDTIKNIKTQKKELQDSLAQVKGTQKGTESPEAAVLKAAEEAAKKVSSASAIIN